MKRHLRDANKNRITGPRDRLLLSLASSGWTGGHFAFSASARVFKASLQSGSSEPFNDIVAVRPITFLRFCNPCKHTQENYMDSEFSG